MASHAVATAISNVHSFVVACFSSCPVRLFFKVKIFQSLDFSDLFFDVWGSELFHILRILFA